MPRSRRIDFVAPPLMDSLGRNGLISTHGVQLDDLGGGLGHERSLVLMRPIRANGDLGRSEITVDGEALGEVATFFAEAFARVATPEAREALGARLAAICAGKPDPGVEAPPPARGPGGMR